MIADFLLSIPAYIIQAMISVLPDGSALPVEWVNAVYSIWSYVNSFSFIVPVNTLLFCLGISLTMHFGVFAWEALNWVIRKIPGMQ